MPFMARAKACEGPMAGLVIKTAEARPGLALILRIIGAPSVGPPRRPRSGAIIGVILIRHLISSGRGGATASLVTGRLSLSAGPRGARRPPTTVLTPGIAAAGAAHSFSSGTGPGGPHGAISRSVDRAAARLALMARADGRRSRTIFRPAPRGSAVFIAIVAPPPPRGSAVGGARS